LRGRHAEGEAGVDEPVRKLAGGALAAGDDLVRNPSSCAYAMPSSMLGNVRAW
jgi:hypothetical protein